MAVVPCTSSVQPGFADGGRLRGMKAGFHAPSNTFLNQPRLNTISARHLKGRLAEQRFENQG
jgi:hypothetical protein